MPRPARRCRSRELPGLDIAELTADPRGYGLHATLKPPFRLGLSWAEAVAAAEALAARLAPFDLPPLAVQDLDGFLALRESAPCPACRPWPMPASRRSTPAAPRPAEAELARRRRSGLSRAPGCAAGALGLSLCLRGMALPRHPDPAPDAGREGRGAARRHRFPRRCAGPAAPGHGDQPLHPGRGRARPS